MESSPSQRKFSKPDRVRVIPWKRLISLELGSESGLLLPAALRRWRSAIYFYSTANILETQSF
jgi:hypothetical protein